MSPQLMTATIRARGRCCRAWECSIATPTASSGSPKNIAVIFRLYQLNFSAPEDFVYRGYWERYAEHGVEGI